MSLDPEISPRLGPTRWWRRGSSAGNGRRRHGLWACANAAILSAVKVHPHPDPRPLPGSEFRLLVEDELFRFLAERRAEAAAPAPDVAVLFDELVAMLRAGGKRLRPLF